MRVDIYHFSFIKFWKIFPRFWKHRIEWLFDQFWYFLSVISTPSIGFFSERFPDGRSADVEAEHIRPSVGSELSEHLPDADDHQTEQKGRHQWGYRRFILVS